MEDLELSELKSALRAAIAGDVADLKTAAGTRQTLWAAVSRRRRASVQRAGAATAKVAPAASHTPALREIHTQLGLLSTTLEPVTAKVCTEIARAVEEWAHLLDGGGGREGGGSDALR